MITAIVGKPGTGKSLQLTRIAKKAIKSGHDVYSNVIMDESKMRLPKKLKKKGTLYYWKDLSQLKFIHNGIVLWDELGAYFDSRAYKDFPADVRVKFQQYRKDGLDVFYTVQAYSRADKIIRDLTNFVQECHSMFNVFWVTEWYPEEYEKYGQPGAKHRGSFFYFGHKSLYEVYDTFQSIQRDHKVEEYKFPLMSDKLNVKS